MDLQKYEKENLDLVLNTAGECAVLLKTDGSFPLEKPCSIAAFGNGVRHTIKGGTGSGEVNSRFSVNIEKGLTDAGFTITTNDWLNEYDEMRVLAKKAFIKGLKAEAKAAHANAMMYSMGKAMHEPEHSITIRGEGDTAIYVVSRDSGEGNDRRVIPGDVKLAASEIRDILLCNETYKNFMLVLNVGGVVDLSEVLEVKNILVLSQLGVVTGNVLADILLGKQNPSGKLTTTWAKHEDYSTLGSFGDLNDTDYKEGIYVGYRYFDAVNVKPLFPFGYGKSYTGFAFSNLKVSVDGDKVSACADITNTGKYAGKEVLEVYISCPQGKLDKPVKELAAFNKSKLLLPGEKETVTAEFSIKDFASYCEETASYILEKGQYLISLGGSPCDLNMAAALTLDTDVTVLKAKNVCGTPNFKDFRATVAPLDIPDSVERIALDSVSLSNGEVAYDKEYPVCDIIKELSDEDLALMGIGSHDPTKTGLAAVIGNASPHIAGAAGETCSLLQDKGIGYLTMSDGPAGLRLARDYFTDEKGAHGIGTSMIPESMLDYIPGILKFLMKAFGLNGSKAPKNAEVKHQYATAIPIGTAIAQSFNKGLAEAYGDMVGSEMERFGVNLWLAPALNIHRSILCGRNFEYYSEDPIISGVFAAAITNGVQKHKGCGTTIKHYAANNQEINRYGCSSNVSERAMREIYLKGFGLCVRESQPHSLMTSYNLLNGLHTSEHRGLVEDILRCEYGFKGIVMTDWTINGMEDKRGKNRNALAGETAKAGVDVFMPGSKGDYDHLLGYLKEGKVTRKQLEINVSRIYQMVEKLTK